MAAENQKSPADAKAVQIEQPAATLSALLKAAIDWQSEAIGIMDRSLRLIAINAAWMSFTGFTEAEAVGRTPMDLYNDRSGRVEAGFLEALAGETVTRTFTAPEDNRLCQVTISPWRDERGEIGGVMTRHEVDDSLRQRSDIRQRRLSLAMEMAKLYAYDIDFRTGEITYEPARPKHVEGAYFHSFDDVLKIVPEAEHEVQREAWEHHLATGELLIMEYPRLTADGGVLWQMSISEAIRDLNNNVIGMVGVTQVIDERKRAELALVAEKEAAQAADRAKSEFLANMSHEIRTPLTSLLGFTDLLRKLDGLSDPARNYIQRISAAGQSLLSVINDVLDFSKLEAGQVELDPHPFAPAACVEDVVDLLAAQAEGKGLRLDFRAADDLPEWVSADSARIHQVLINLVGNAVKFTDSGQVVVTAAFETAPSGAGQLRIAVSDTGPGIAEDVRDRLFQRFSQVDGSVSRQHGGSGLGLAICKSLIDLMGGVFGVDSEVGVGSTFWFAVPVTIAAPAAEPAELSDRDGPAIRPLHILLVDDVAVNRELVRAMLTPFGHSFEEADNGAEAVKAAMGSRFDLILMDLQMPGMDGFAAARAIRATAEPNRATPILALSANVLAEHTAAARAAGMDDHIGKPIRPIELLTKIAIWTSATTENLNERQTASRASAA